MSDFSIPYFRSVLSLLLFGIISVLAYNHETALLVYRAIFKAFPSSKNWRIRSSLPRLHFLHYLVRKDII